MGGKSFGGIPEGTDSENGYPQQIRLENQVVFTLKIYDSDFRNKSRTESS